MYMYVIHTCEFERTIKRLHAYLYVAVHIHVYVNLCYVYTLRRKGANRASVGSLRVPYVVFGVLHFIKTDGWTSQIRVQHVCNDGVLYDICNIILRRRDIACDCVATLKSAEGKELHTPMLNFCNLCKALVTPTRIRYCNLSFVVTPDTIGLRRIGINVCEIVGKSCDIIQQSNDSRTIVER